MRNLPTISSLPTLLPALLIVGLTAGWPDIATAAVSLPSSELPPESDPTDCASITSFYSAEGAVTVYASGLQWSDPKLECFQHVVRSTIGDDESQNFDAVMEGDMDGGSGPVAVTLTGPVQTIVRGKAGSPTGTWAAEILSIAMSGMAGSTPVMVRESPTVASTGQISVADAGGGQFLVESFFDVFTEVSTDGGSSWTPSTGSTHLMLVATGNVQVLDHYKCYKVRDLQRLKAIVNLDSPTFGLETGCVVTRTMKYCVPVMKTVVESSVPGGAFGPGQELLDDRICYRLSCGPTLDISPVVEDQFGVRELTKFKPVEICTPARKISD